MKPVPKPKVPTPRSGSSELFKRLEHFHAELKARYDLVDDIYLHPDVYDELVKTERLTVPTEGDAKGRLTVVTYVGPVDLKSHPLGATLKESE